MILTVTMAGTRPECSWYNVCSGSCGGRLFAKRVITEACVRLSSLLARKSAWPHSPSFIAYSAIDKRIQLA